MKDPFAILSVTKTADKKQILTQVTHAMRSKQSDMKSIAEAQKILFNPLTRAVAEFSHCIDIEPFVDAADVRINDGSVKLEIISIYNEKSAS